MNVIGSAGNKGKGIRSDCFVSVEPAVSGGIDIQLQSKVKVLYGKAITAYTKKVLAYFGIDHAKVVIEDTGALDFVLAARIEAAVKQAIKTDKEFLPDMMKNNIFATNKEKNRRSRLYLPGNSPSFMINAGLHKPDGLIFDLEDSVAPAKKYEARFLVRNALRAVDSLGAERMVRINQIPAGLDDLPFIIPHNVNLILVPKCEHADQIHKVDAAIKELSKKHGIQHQIWLMPIIESAVGVINSYEIAKASENVAALAVGLEDYTADLGARRTKEADESFYARSQVVNAAKAAGIQAIDSVFSDVADMEGLLANVRTSKGLGFEGMGCIHPRQIRVIHEGYAPDADELDKAKKIVIAFNEATAQGFGVVSLGSKMIDPPVVKRALKMIQTAIDCGMIAKNWSDEYDKKDDAR